MSNIVEAQVWVSIWMREFDCKMSLTFGSRIRPIKVPAFVKEPPKVGYFLKCRKKLSRFSIEIVRGGDRDRRERERREKERGERCNKVSAFLSERESAMQGCPGTQKCSISSHQRVWSSHLCLYPTGVHGHDQDPFVLELKAQVLHAHVEGGLAAPGAI